MNDVPISVAAAQTLPCAGDVTGNVSRHVELVEIAARRKASIVIFPELSLTGYEPSIAAECAMTVRDAELRPLKHISDHRDITIIAGAPVRADELRPHIGAFVIRPQRDIQIYRKRFLHPGEETHFAAGQEAGVFQSHGHRIGIAICAEVGNERHPEDAAELGATIYAAGVAMTPRGIEKAEENLSTYARRHQFLAVMANYGGDTGGYPMAGQSGAWDDSGTLIAKTDGMGERLVLVESRGGRWRGTVVGGNSA